MKMDQISNFKKSIPDGERFLQEPLSQYSYWRANAYIGGQNPLTWEGIYQEKDRMRKVIVSEMITLDGFFAGPDGEIDWHVVDEDFNERTLEFFRSVDTLVFGRVTYELMAKYWPTEAAQTDDPLIAEKMNTLPKVVFSRTLEKAEWGEWRDVTAVKGNPEEEIAKLKQGPGKDIVIFGSGEIVSILARAGLIDDYLLYVSPVVLGSGIPLFKSMKEGIKLQLVNVQNLSSGVVRLHYRSVNSLQ
jgi:dihydrofolate reductase